MSHSPGQVIDVLGEILGPFSSATSTVPLYSFQSAQSRTAIANSKPSMQHAPFQQCLFNGGTTRESAADQTPKRKRV